MPAYLTEHPALALVAVVVLGITAQILAQRVRLPSILLLLLFGVGVSPAGLGLLDPALLVGNNDLLFAFVSLSVAVILFEGGLTLRVRELTHIGKPLWLMVTVGAAITWVLGALGCRTIAGLPVNLSVLLGALLIVTGPTVIGPLLRHVRPTGKVGSLVKWEGIIGDPIGAILAVLVFEVILHGTQSGAVAGFLLGVGNTVLIGGALGAFGAWLLTVSLERHWIPDFLQGVTSLALALALFELSNVLQHESGLLTVTLMGIGLANQVRVPVRHIIELKEHLTVLLISCLFIVLAARMTPEKLSACLGWRSIGFVAFLIVVVRPLAVLVATGGTGLSRAEKVFVAWMAPRGIVAAAVASLFGRELGALGVEGHEMLEPLVFTVVVGTVATYGLTIAPLSYRLGVAQRRPQGVLILGAHDWARAVALALQKAGISVLLIDTNRANIRQARMAGLPAQLGNLLEEHIIDELDLPGIGRLLAVTPNSEANSLAALLASELFGRANVYQLREPDQEALPPAHLRGKLLFAPGLDYDELASRLGRGEVIKATRLTPEFGYEEYQSTHGDEAAILFTIGPTGVLGVHTGDAPPQEGDTVLSMTKPVEKEGKAE